MEKRITSSREIENFFFRSLRVSFCEDRKKSEVGKIKYDN